MLAMIIDFHAHIYPEKIAQKATDSISNFYEDAPMAWHGRSDELIASGSKIEVEKYIVHSTATKATQVESINNFIIGECNAHPEFVGFGTIHPDYENYSAELERIRKAGLQGIKIHSDFQKFQLDTPAMDSIYDKIEELNMPVLFHAGDKRYDFSGPKRILNLHKKHPNLIIIAAHFGGYTEWENSLKYLAGQDVYFDTSSTLWKLPYDKADELIKAHGYKRFLFGSDFPMWDHTDELGRFNKLTLTAEERQAILYDNGADLLKKISQW